MSMEPVAAERVVVDGTVEGPIHGGDVILMRAEDIHVLRHPDGSAASGGPASVSRRYGTTVRRKTD